jgi:hypothetical protein
MLGVPWQDYVGQDHVLIFLCAWHVLKAWHLHSMEKIKDSNVRRVILDRLHMVLLMYINLDDAINDFKARGRELVMESFYKYNLVLLGQNTFGFIIVNLVSKGSPFQVWHVLKSFCYGCITWMHVQFSHIFKLHHGLEVCCGCPCRALDGWASSGAPLKLKHTS